MKLYKVGSNNCPGCKKLQGMLEHYKIEVIPINIDEPEGLKFAQEHGISTLPSLVKVTDNGTEKLLGLRSLQETLSFCSYCDIL